jgi:bifunctional DNA-binding transcriptional regulator/antitoxin component of YhaV-PrlF toxin-antitoxin module
MATAQFKLPIGAKRQVTIPRACMDLLSLEEGGELLLEVVGDHATLAPVVSIRRSDLPEELRKKFEARRGRKSSDIPLGEFLDELAPKSVADNQPRSRSVVGKRKNLA